MLIALVLFLVQVAKLVQELCNASTAVMFDLVLIAYQVNIAQ